MDVLKIFLLIFLSLILVFAGWLYLAAMGTETTLLSTDYYINILSKTDLTSVLYSELDHFLPDIIFGGIATAGNAEFENEEKLLHDRIGILVKAFTTAYDSLWFEEQLILIIDDLLATIKGEKPGLTASINLEENKEQFLTEITAELDKLPVEARVMLDMTDEDLSLIWNEFAIPDQIMIADLFEENISNAELQRVISIQRLSRFLFLYLSYALFAVLLLLFCLLAGAGGGFKWFGASVLFFSSTFLVGLQILRLLLTEVAIVNIPDYIAFPTDIFQTTVNYTVTRISFGPLICLAIGLFFLIIGVITKKRTPKLEMSQ